MFEFVGCVKLNAIRLKLTNHKLTWVKPASVL